MHKKLFDSGYGNTSKLKEEVTNRFEVMKHVLCCVEGKHGIQTPEYLVTLLCN